MKVSTVAIDVGFRNPQETYNSIRGPNTYLLESAEGGEKVARYSFIGFNNIAKIVMRNGKATVVGCEEFINKMVFSETMPLELLREFMNRFEYDCKSGPRFFGGLVGYLSYDIIRYYVELEKKRDALYEPDCEFLLAKNIIVFDHKAKKTHLAELVFGDYDEEEIKKRLSSIATTIYEKPIEKRRAGNLKVSSNINRAQFQDMVSKAIDYILSGDIIQAVLSQRFECDFDGDSLRVFDDLKKINPSPYMYHLDLGKRKIVGSSPEMLARIEGDRVVTYPIAGTRGRGRDEEEDLMLEKELLSDEKERAEHLMLVDLGRNDIGRVARFGTVEVKKFMNIEKYSHVQHIVSEVEGCLKEGVDCYDALRSIFPAGTVSGAPKVRAMEIINELEPDRRGIYSGAIGYFSFTGNMDTAIAIRTVIIEDNKAFVQAGAGIVADSVPAREFAETEKKARGILKALEGL